MSELKVAVDSLTHKYDGWTLLFSQLIKEKESEYLAEDSESSKEDDKWHKEPFGKLEDSDNEELDDSDEDESDYMEILHGDVLGLPDTVTSLKSLSELDDGAVNPGKSHERNAASGLYSWKEDVFVGRAPGRLDVMGGIAYYFGSLVLQMPTIEACHVVIQKIHPTKQKLWKHAQT